MAIENVTVKKAHEYPVPEDMEDVDAARDKEMSDKDHRLHRRLLEWYQQEREKQAINRYQQAIDEDFYDHLQWSDDDAEELKSRGQAPLVFNDIKPVIDWIIGTERRTRIDYRILPRGEEDAEGATVKTKLLKYVSDVNNAPFARSRAFSESAKAGLGWLEEGITLDPESELLYVRMESWRNMIYDSNSVELDLSDARFLFRHRWLDLDIAQAAFPQKKEALRRAAVASDLFGNDQDEDLWYLGQRLQERDSTGAVIGRRTYISDAMYVNNRRERVKLIEAWYREPKSAKMFYGDGPLHNQEYDKSDPTHQEALQSGSVSLVDRLYLKMHCAIITDGDLIWSGPSPYRHNKFPFTPIWAYRRKRDNAPYGPVRGLRDPQEDLNKRASKALHILSTKGVIAEEGAFNDEDEARAELARPDYFLTKKKGAEVEINQDTNLADAHMKLMEMDSARIRNGSGVTTDNLGQESNAISGRAIIARQTQGSVVTTELFDNYRLAIQLSGQKQLSLIEQYYTDTKAVRITGKRGSSEFLKINKFDENTGRMLNDITAAQADFVVGEQEFQQSLRIAMFEAMMEMTSKMAPEMAIKFLDLVFELSDLPNKDDIVSRIRMISGIVPDGENLSPKEQKQVQDMLAQQQKSQGLQDTLMEAQVQELAAKIDNLRADLAKKKAEASKTSVEAQNAAIGQVGNTLTGAAAVAAQPGLAPIADAMLESAGFPDATPAAGISPPAPTQP